MKNFSLILPTRNRPLLVKRLFSSIIKNTSDLKSLEIILYLDDDDTDSQGILTSAFSMVRLIKPRNTMGNMLRQCYDVSCGRYVVLLNDDAVIRTKNWDTLIFQASLAFPDNIALIYANDCYYGSRIPTFPILSRNTCDLMGKICPSEYKRHCIELHILDIFKRLSKLGHKRLIYLSKIIFEHMNYELAEFSYGDMPTTDYRDDQSLYRTLAEDRQRIAEKMAQEIIINTVKEIET